LPDRHAGRLVRLTADIIASSDAVLVPQQAEPLGIRSVPKMLEGLNRLRVIHPRLVVLGVLMTMVQQDMAESRESVAALRQLLPGDLVLRTMIPRDALFVKASARGLPIGVLEEGAGALAVFDALRAEIEAKLERSGVPTTPARWIRLNHGSTPRRVRRLAERLLADSNEPEVQAGRTPASALSSSDSPWTRRGAWLKRLAPVRCPNPQRRSLSRSRRRKNHRRLSRVSHPAGQGPLLERLARFRDALIRHTGAQGVFILDREGKAGDGGSRFWKAALSRPQPRPSLSPVSGTGGQTST
jgi:hypothetical protein